MTTRFIGHLLTGTHAARPAASAVPEGTLYSCTDHSLVYQSDTATWATWLTSAAGSVATDAIWDTAGDLAVGTGANTAAKLAAGATSGHVLTSNGSGVAPSWQAAGGGGALVLLEQQTASASASLDFTTFISSTYDTYKIEGVGLVMATDNVDLRVQVGTGGGPTYDTGNNYQWARLGFSTGGGANNDSGTTGAGARIFNAMDTGLVAFAFGSFSFTATNLQSTTLNKIIQGTGYYLNNSSDALLNTWLAVWITSGTAATALRFVASSGNIASGTIRIYGVTK